MELNVLRLLEKTADRFNKKTAYSDSDESLSFSEVEERAKRIGSALAEKIPARSPVAVMSGRRVHTPVIFLG
ncbi:MAG: AMP-binding protein, partial [Ruminococcus sp.]|nr:AMP-binding protein [Ruminococcus sp.]